MKILITGDLFSSRHRDLVREFGYTVNLPMQPEVSEDVLVEAVADCDGYIVAGHECVTERVLHAASRLRAISFVGTGYHQAIDIEAATRLGIPVTTTAGVNARAVAEFTLGLLLSLAKGLTMSCFSAQQGIWANQEALQLEGKKLGIVGMGMVGTQVARMARDGLGMEVVYTSRTRKPLLEMEGHIHYTPLVELLSQVDILSLHLPYVPGAPPLLGASELHLMKFGAIIVNTARPWLIDPYALRFTLRDQHIAALAMDGYYQEPPDVAHDPYCLLACRNVMITPHTAFRTHEAVEQMIRQSIENIHHLLAEGKTEARFCVNAHVLAQK